MAFCGNCGRELFAPTISCPICGTPAPAAAQRGGLATWGQRAGAHAIEAALTIGLLVLYGMVTAPGVEPSAAEREAFLERYRLAAFATTFVSFMLIKPLLEGWRGRSLGKMIVGLQVVSARDGAAITYAQSFGRALAAFGIGFIPFAFLVDGLWPLRDPQRQTLHDKVARTIVLQGRRGT